jgi:hypothetical protein
LTGAYQVIWKWSHLCYWHIFLFSLHSVDFRQITSASFKAPDHPNILPWPVEQCNTVAPFWPVLWAFFMYILVIWWFLFSSGR